MSSASLALPLPYRQRALEQLTILIAQAEDGSTRRAGERPTAARAGSKCRFAEGHLELLRRSRQYLLTGDLPAAA
jgi:hypothetical protein